MNRSCLGFLLVSCFLGACGGGDGLGDAGVTATDGGSNQDAGQAPPGCVVLPVDRLTPAQVSGFFSAEVAPKGLSTGTLRVELNQHKGVKQVPGTFPLDSPPDDNYATCNHCVALFIGDSADPQKAEKIFFQGKGSMTLDTVASPPNAETKGSTLGVALYEVTLDPISYKSTRVSGGACFFIPSLSWDGTVPIGKTCENARDCGDTNTKVCDPKTKTCLLGQCGGSSPCSQSQICIGQVEDAPVGACYPACTPFSSTCSANAECLVESFDQADGYCVERGSAKEGDACKHSDVTSSCATGLVCASEVAGSFCRKQCDLTKSTSQCPSLQVCVIGSYCSTEPVDPAAIGSACDSTAHADAPCGLSGALALGICAYEKTDGGNESVCRKFCRMSTASDCPANAKCQSYYGTVGVCR